MKKTLLICCGLILFIPLSSIAVDITHKIGVIISTPLTVQNIQNLSFGMWRTIDGYETYVVVYADGQVTGSYCNSTPTSPLKTGQPGIIKVTGYGYISIQSTAPTNLVHTTDSTKTLTLNNMKIVNSDGSNISNMNKIEINGEKEFKTIGSLKISKTAEVIKGEYKADWPITIDYIGYEPY